MIVCIFEHVQWRWALNERLAHGYSCRCAAQAGPAGPTCQRWTEDPWACTDSCYEAGICNSQTGSTEGGAVYNAVYNSSL
jgi:hypothetical protein